MSASTVADFLFYFFEVPQFSISCRFFLLILPFGREIRTKIILGADIQRIYRGSLISVNLIGRNEVK